MLHLLKFRFGRAGNDVRPTFFLHIPKCAGSSLWEAIWDIYGTRHVFVAKSQAQHAKLTAMPPERRRSYLAIGGHGRLTFFRDMLGDMTCYHKIVTLRDPIDRSISEFNYISARPQHRLHAEVVRRGFEGFVSDVLGPNRQVRLLAGRNDDVAGAVEIVTRFFDDWSLSQNLDDLTERLYRMAEVTPRPAKHKNRTRSGLSRGDLEPATLRLLEERNKYDLELIERLSAVR